MAKLIITAPLETVARIRRVISDAGLTENGDCFFTRDDKGASQFVMRVLKDGKKYLHIVNYIEGTGRVTGHEIYEVVNLVDKDYQVTEETKTLEKRIFKEVVRHGT